jgi:hypothetical protein
MKPSIKPKLKERLQNVLSRFQQNGFFQSCFLFTGTMLRASVWTCSVGRMSSKDECSPLPQVMSLAPSLDAMKRQDAICLGEG